MRRIVLVLVVFLLGACAARQGVVDDATTPISDGALQPYRYRTGIVYTPPGWPERLRGDLYAPEAAGSELRPAVVLVHGGAWFRGNRGEMIHIAQALAERGYIAFSVDYRLVPQARYPAPVDDVRVAVRWLDAHADELGVDRRRIALWGYSSGAQIAALLAADAQPGAPRIKAAVLGAMPADLVQMADLRIVERYIGLPLDEARDAYVSASPLARINAHSAPMFLYHGSWDWMIGPDNARRMYAGLQALGVTSELYLQPGTGHFTTFLYDRGALRAALAFLDRQLDVAPPALIATTP
ncbi:MAG: alpha/beta hydrolase [Solimonas sp.]